MRYIRVVFFVVVAVGVRLCEEFEHARTMSAMRERVCARVFARVCVHGKRKQVMGEYLNACRDGNRVCLCVCVCASAMK